MQINKQLKQEILNWHIKTFPNVSFISQFKKLLEELKEAKNIYHPYEFADCEICLIGISRFRFTGLLIKLVRYYLHKKYYYFLNMDEGQINRILKDKFEMNKKRKWRLENGVYKHIEEIE